MPIVVISWNSTGKTLSADLVNDQCKAQVLRDHVILSETKDLAELCQYEEIEDMVKPIRYNALIKDNNCVSL